MIDLRDLSIAFGYRGVSMLANAMGYTRQGLYAAMRNGGVQKIRMKASLEHLREISKAQYEEDIIRAERLKNIREQGISDMESIFGIHKENY